MSDIETADAPDIDPAPDSGPRLKWGDRPSEPEVDTFGCGFWEETEEAETRRRSMCFLFGQAPNHARRKVCKRCAVPFIDNGPFNKRHFCSHQCAYLFNGKRYRERQRLANMPELKKCKRCLCGFFPRFPKSQLFCTVRCQREDAHDRDLAARGKKWGKGAEVACKCGCGVIFPKLKHNQLFYNDACRQRQGQRNWRSKDRVMRLRKFRCGFCKKSTFTTRPSKKYCSANCCQKAFQSTLRTTSITRQCVVCGKDFDGINGKRKSCPGECERQLMRIRNQRRNLPKTERACVECGASFQSNLHNQRFCCPEHADLHRAKLLGKNYPTANCLLCGAEFDRRTITDKFCCRQHGNAHRRRLRKPEMAAYVSHSDRKANKDHASTNDCKPIAEAG